jgi:hypothetical protein
MESTMRRVFALMLAFVLVITAIPVTDTVAASKPKLSRTTGTVVVGESLTLSVKNFRGGIL